MSSVGSSDSSNSTNRQDEAIRRAREEAKKSEADLVKKQTRQMRRANEQHYAELERLKQEHRTQMEAFKESAHTDINERDHRYQKDMDEMRGLYRKQLQESADETQRRESTLRKTSEAELEQIKSRTKAQSEAQSTSMNKNIRDKDETYATATEQSREAQQEAIAKNKERVERHYEAQLNTLKEERNQKVGTLQKEYEEYRQNTQGRIRDQDLRHMQQQQRSSDNLVKTVQKERLAAQDSTSLLREGFRDATETTRDRFQKAAQKEREISQMARNSLAGSVNERIDNQVERLESDNERLRDAKIRDEVLLRHQVKREVGNIKEGYQKNVEAYKQERDEIVRTQNDRGRQDLMKVHEQTSKQTVEMARQNRLNQEDANRIHRSAYENLRSDFGVRHDQAKTLADQRVKNIHEVTSQEKSRIMEKQLEDHTINQQVKQDELRSLQATMEADKQQTVLRMKDQLNKQEVQHTEKMVQVVAKYEKQIQTLKDQMIRDKKLSDENLKRVTDELQRAHKTGMDQIASQNRERIRQVGQQHNEELRSVNKRHEEKLDQVVGELKRG